MDFDFAPGALPGSLELAYLGDSLYDLYVRAALVRAGGHVRDMHRAAVTRVCAHAQAEAMARVEGVLTERERDVARRARNAHQTPPKKRRRRRVPSRHGAGGPGGLSVRHRADGAHGGDTEAGTGGRP